MFAQATILSMIKQVVKAIDNGSNEEEKKIAHQLVDTFIPQKEKVFNIFYVKDKTIYYKYSNKKVYETTCNEETFNKYIGCSLVEGYHRYGSKTKYHKHLKQFYGCETNDLEKYSLIDAYTRFGGKANFEKFVDKKYFPKTETTETTETTE